MNTTRLKIKEIKISFNKYLSIIFEKPKNFTFYPGQYLDIELPVNDPDGKTRAFTISSSPTEKFLIITPKIGITPYKKFMEKLKIEDEIQTSHPAGTFTLDENSPAVFIAGGVGITPFRSMVKYAVDNKLKTPITLIYSNSDSNFLFKKELEAWKKVYLKLNIVYINTIEKGRLSTIETRYLILNTIYYLAGSHSFVNTIEKILLDLGIDEADIRYDRFDGYN